jgi:type I restriction enzyme R subunit
MVGRGTRIDVPSGKMMFRVYDYTDATRLFGKEFITKPPRPGGRGDGGGDVEPPIRVEGVEIHVTPAGHLILTDVDGKATPVTVEEYKHRLASKLVEEAPTLDTFRKLWVVPTQRQELMGKLPDAGRSPQIVRELEEKRDFDLYDVLAELGYGQAPKTREERADAFSYKNSSWLDGMPLDAAGTVRAIASQFALAGTDGLENREIFQTPAVRLTGGLTALKKLGKPAEIMQETKERMLAA